MAIADAILDRLRATVESFCCFVEGQVQDGALPERASSDGDWGPQEALAHLLYHHEHYVAQAEARLLSEPFELLAGRWSDINAAAVEASRGVPVAELTGRLRAANERLCILSLATDPAAITMQLKRGAKPRTLDELLPEIEAHVRNHLQQLRAKHKRGQPQARLPQPQAISGGAVPDQLASQNSTLLVIDVQRGLFGKSTPIWQAERLLANVELLIAHAHEAGALVVYVQHSAGKSLAPGSDDWQLHPQLQPAGADLIVQKQHGNAFEQTSLERELRGRGIGRVVVAGLVTHGCVRATCIGACELGYRVVLAEDAHSSYSNDAAKLIAEWNQKLGARGVELRPAAEIRFLANDGSDLLDPGGKEML